LLDLAHWVDGDYRVAGESMTDDVSIEDADPAPDPSPRHAEPPDPPAGRPRR
jgi:endogenous inhibitor of DNA gyrase (YacG/DUF329 family)